MSKPNAVADLMVKLSVDPMLRRRFQESPAEVLSAAELSEEEFDLVAGGNPDRIRQYLGADAPSECCVLFVSDD
jgi:hypothetical protein